MSLNLIRLIDEFLLEQPRQHRISDRTDQHTGQHTEKEFDANGQQGHGSRDERFCQDSSRQGRNNI